MPTWQVWNSDRVRVTLQYFSLLLLESSCLWKILCSHCADSTSEIMLRKPQPMLTPPGQYDIKAGSSVKPNNPSPSLVQSFTTNVVLWALHHPFREQYTNCMWTAPGWAGHSTQQSFGWKIVLSHPHPHISLLIISWFCNKDSPISLEIMDRLSSKMHLFSLRIVSAALQVSGEICEHRLKDQQARRMWF